MNITPENFTEAAQRLEYPFPFVIDNENKAILETLCQYLSLNPEFEKDGMSLKKGILLMGSIGCGKTYIMKIITDAFRPKMKLVNCRKVASEYSMKGDEGIEKYIGTAWDMRLPRYCFDDFGTEPIKHYYGSQVNVMAEVLFRRYDYGNYYKTFLTTNLTAGEIKDKYGDRLADRFREMFNVITFPESKSRRV